MSFSVGPNEKMCTCVNENPLIPKMELNVDPCYYSWARLNSILNIFLRVLQSLKQHKWLITHKKGNKTNALWFHLLFNIFMSTHTHVIYSI